MPAGDRTGPVGYGPRTGRGAGFCSGFAAPGFANTGLANPVLANPGFGGGRGFGRARGAGFRGGRGRGFGRGFGFGRPWAAPYPGYGYEPGPAAPAPEDELSALKQEAGFLKTELDNINQRISELQSGND